MIRHWEVARVRRRSGPPPLTRRQRQVAELIREGKTNRQIGEALGISMRTVNTYLYRLYIRLRLRRRAEIAAWVREQGGV